MNNIQFVDNKLTMMMNIWLSVEQTNQVLNALGELPYKDVSSLINHIQIQANRQLESMQEQTEVKQPAENETNS